MKKIIFALMLLSPIISLADSVAGRIGSLTLDASSGSGTIGKITLLCACPSPSTAQGCACNVGTCSNAEITFDPANEVVFSVLNNASNGSTGCLYYKAGFPRSSVCNLQVTYTNNNSVCTVTGLHLE